jgi:hypothetical protein
MQCLPRFDHASERDGYDDPEMLHLQKLTDFLRADEDAIRRANEKMPQIIMPVNNHPANYVR